MSSPFESYDDLDDADDRCEVLRLYGDPRSWTRRLVNGSGHYEWISAALHQLRDNTFATASR